MESPFKISDYELFLFNEGTNHYSYRMLGAHFKNKDPELGTRFSVWAPNARNVSVVGEFNNWDGTKNPMKKLGESGVWLCFIPGIEEYDMYKYEITGKDGQVYLKSDPFGFYSEFRPGTASRVVSLEGHIWGDQKWQEQKENSMSPARPVLIYEVHPGSWDRKDDGGFLTYREMGERLVDYASDMGYTHIELLPIMEHPLDESWGYQVTGFFSVTSRYGTPYDFMYFVDRCHQKGIGVILDWVPAHFPKDAHGLCRFDGTSLYECENPLLSEQRAWGTLTFNYRRNEVKSFLISSALFWLDIYHIDGLRVDAVSSMLYLDYGRGMGEWIPNRYGGRENLEAVKFLKDLNEAVQRDFKGAFMIAEESTAWPRVTGPVHLGGLGFSHKWNMGWMNDVLRYMAMSPSLRRENHSLITFSMTYSFTEDFILPLSHDEVVHEKKSLLDKMYGDYLQKFANLKALYGYMMAHPGKKLLFMGGEFGQFIEWRFDRSLDWCLLEFDMHQKLHEYVRELNIFYISQRPLWENDRDWEGFKWIEPNDFEQSVISFIRTGRNPGDILVVVCNFSPSSWEGYRIGILYDCEYEEVFNSDDLRFGGSGQNNKLPVKADMIPSHGQPYSISIRVPPLAAVFFKPLRPDDQSVSQIKKQIP